MDGLLVVVVGPGPPQRGGIAPARICLNTFLEPTEEVRRPCSCALSAVTVCLHETPLALKLII